MLQLHIFQRGVDIFKGRCQAGVSHYLPENEGVGFPGHGEGGKAVGEAFA